MLREPLLHAGLKKEKKLEAKMNEPRACSGHAPSSWPLERPYNDLCVVIREYFINNNV